MALTSGSNQDNRGENNTEPIEWHREGVESNHPPKF
jgi:hypothetical protein